MSQPKVKKHTFMDGAASFMTQSKKHFIVMARYPVNFITSFATVLLFMMMFVLAAVMFSDPNDPDAASSFSGIIAYGFGRHGHTGTIESTHAMALLRGDGVTWAVTVAGRYPGESTALESIVNRAFEAGGFISG